MSSPEPSKWQQRKERFFTLLFFIVLGIALLG